MKPKMKTFIPIFISTQGSLASLIRDVNASGYKIDEQKDIVVLLDSKEDLGSPDKIFVAFQSISDQLSDTIIEYLEAQSDFCVVICMDIMSLNVANFMVHLIEDLRRSLSFPRINFSFTPPGDFLSKASKTVRSLFVTGPTMASRVKAAKLIASWENPQLESEEDEIVDGRVFKIVPRYVSESDAANWPVTIKHLGDTVKIISDKKFADIKHLLFIPAEQGHYLVPMSGTGWLMSDILEAASEGLLPLMISTTNETIDIKAESSGASVFYFSEQINNIIEDLESNGSDKNIYDDPTAELFFTTVEDIEFVDSIYPSCSSDGDDKQLQLRIIQSLARR